MKSKRKLLKGSRLYVVIDRGILGNNIASCVGKIKESDSGIIQYRDKISSREIILKNTRIIRKLLLNSKIFIINDYVDIAKILDCDGVHLGQDDLPIEIARSLLGKHKIIGMSCHNLRQAIVAQDKGADYISIGPIFPTSTKPEYKPVGLDLIKEVSKRIKIPFFAIGGINTNNLNKVKSAGAKRVAVCKAICQAKNINSSIRDLKEQLEKN